MSTMKLLKTDQGVVVNVYVKPDAREFEIEVEDDELVVTLPAAPVKGKANKELVKELSKLFKRKIEIVTGFTSKPKRVLIKDISLDEVGNVISKLKAPAP